jgi:DNA-binding beta-propeller fold protein YncE
VVLGDAPGVMRIVLGVGDSIGTRVDSSAVRTRLTDPRGVAFDPDASLLFVGDRGSVRQVSGISTPVARLFSVTSRGAATLLLDGGGCTSGTCLFQPTAMAMAPDGSLVIADQVGNRVFRFSTARVLSVIAGDGTTATAPDGATAATSPISRPAGVAVRQQWDHLHQRGGRTPCPLDRWHRRAPDPGRHRDARPFRGWRAGHGRAAA